MSLRSKLKDGNLTVGGVQVQWQVRRPQPPHSRQAPSSPADLTRTDLKLHLGPGPGWSKPDDSWVTVDIDPDRADVVMDFNAVDPLPIPTDHVAAVYGSHVFEHMHPVAARHVFSELHRVLQPGGVLRIVAPDARKSLERYLAGDGYFPLFERRRDRSRQRWGIELTLFEAMREDFISMAGQTELLGAHTLAHQNAWDFDSMVADLGRAGFDPAKVERVDFQQSRSRHFAFEGTYPSEANEVDRSMYVEATA